MSDTLRYDHLGCNGNQWIQTPNLDAFSKRCLVFDRTYQVSFPTIPTRIDMMTGRLTFPFRGLDAASQRRDHPGRIAH